MKGLVFTELLRMAEDALGEDVVDGVLDSADLPSGGSYTAVGSYSCGELVELVLGFSDASGHSPETLQRMFGRWMFGYFMEKYPRFFADKADAFALLSAIDGEIHVEVAKLYPDAELPRFRTSRAPDGGFVLHYSSPRPLLAFCRGLVEACLDHYGETASVTVTRIDADVGVEADIAIRPAA